MLKNQSLDDLCKQILGLKYKLFNYKARNAKKLIGKSIYE